jgi:VanZ family protein
MRLLVRWLPAVGMMLVIFLASATPSRQLPSFGPQDFLVKKGGHLIAYSLLALAYLHGLGRQNHAVYLAAWMLAAAYALTDELHQSFVPGRGSWLGDVGIDAAGAALALFLSWLRH